MKSTYAKPNLKQLGLLRVVTKFSCGPNTNQNVPTSDHISFKGSDIDFTWRW
jgi:hypothetical protein